MEPYIFRVHPTNIADMILGAVWRDPSRAANLYSAICNKSLVALRAWMVSNIDDEFGFFFRPEALSLVDWDELAFVLPTRGERPSLDLERVRSIQRHYAPREMLDAIEAYERDEFATQGGLLGLLD